jgi:hypothetical protein
MEHRMDVNGTGPREPHTKCANFERGLPSWSTARDTAAYSGTRRPHADVRGAGGSGRWPSLQRDRAVARASVVVAAVVVGGSSGASACGEPCAERGGLGGCSGCCVRQVQGSRTV